MSKVESNDEIRIREMQEAHRRKEVRNREADRARRSERTFQETMHARSSQEQGIRAREGTEKRIRDDVSSRSVLEQVRESQPKHPHELAKQAALARAVHGKGALLQRAKDSQGDALVLENRRDAYDTVRAEEYAHVNEVDRDDDTRETDARETQQDDVLRDLENAKVLEDALSRERRERRDRDGSEDESHEASKARVEGPTPTHRSSAPARVIPPEILKRIVGTITKLVGDGRTRLRVRLKGRGLEGVELEIRAEDGRVACTFSGCNDRLRRDLEASELALAKSLEARGLRLKSLEAR